MNQNERIIDPLAVGEALRDSLSAVFEAIPNCSARPTDIARTLDASRVMISRTISAIRKESPTELLVSIPGPESLRTIMYAAKVAGTDPGVVQEALDTVADFQSLLKGTYGTRAAFNAAIGVNQDQAKAKFEQDSRYLVYKGMSQMLGVQCEAWVSTAIISPNKADPTMLDRSSIFGASGLRRLRPDTPTRLAIGLGPRKITAKFPNRDMSGVRKNRKLIDLNQFCTNPQAPVATIDEGERVIDVFSPPMGDKESVYDLLSGAYVPNAVPRDAGPKLTRRGNIVTTDVPASALILDLVIHCDLFHGAIPEGYVYNTGLTGTVRFDSKNWQLNRVAHNANIQSLDSGLENIDIDEVDRYPDMVRHVCRETDFDPSEFRLYRWRVEYPVFGFQHVFAFPVIKPDGI